MLLKDSGMSNHNAASSLRLPAIAHLGLLAAIAGAALFATPNPVSASSSQLVEASAKVTLDLARSVAVRTSLDDLWLEPIVPPTPAALASSALVDRLMNVLANGVQVTQAARQGTLFVDFEQRGFGGVLVLRYRR